MACKPELSNLVAFSTTAGFTVGSSSELPVGTSRDLFLASTISVVVANLAFLLIFTLWRFLGF
jgi:hypothetical protein